MTQVDVSNPDLLRSIDPIRKAVYDEGNCCNMFTKREHGFGFLTQNQRFCRNSVCNRLVLFFN